MLRSKQHAPAISLLLTEPEPDDDWGLGQNHPKAAAAFALGRLGAREYNWEIAALLNHRLLETRLAAAGALADLEAKEYAGQVVDLLEDLEDPRFDGDRVIRVLGGFHVRDYAGTIAAFLDHDAAESRGVAAMALAELGAEEYADDIADLLREEDLHKPGLHAFSLMWAARALATLGARDHAEEIAILLKASDPQLQAEGIGALAKLDAREYNEQIAAFLNNPLCCWADHPETGKREYLPLGEVAARVLRNWGMDPREGRGNSESGRGEQE